jgi:hypothetical protein
MKATVVLLETNALYPAPTSRVRPAWRGGVTGESLVSDNHDSEQSDMLRSVVRKGLRLNQVAVLIRETRGAGHQTKRQSRTVAIRESDGQLSRERATTLDTAAAERIVTVWPSA